MPPGGLFTQSGTDNLIITVTTVDLTLVGQFY